MREIKFRIWCKQNESMQRVSKIGFDEGKLWYVLDEDHETQPPYFEDDDDWVLMQYTGLKDKNGKEIYEGDIVDYLGDIDHINSNVLRVIEYKNEEACFVARLPVGVEGEEAVYLNEHDFKVIGNIYENPELLEELQNESK